MLGHRIKGSIITISSLSAQSAASKVADYQCSKAGLSMLTKSVAYEMAPLGMRVNTISPGLAETGINQDQWEDNPKSCKNRILSFVPTNRAGKHDDFYGVVIFLASNESSSVTGTNINVDGGTSAI